MPTLQIAMFLQSPPPSARGIPPPPERATPPVHSDAASSRMAQRVEEAARVWHSARDTALNEGWSLDGCALADDVPRNATLAQDRYAYVKSLIPERDARGVPTSLPLRHPWRACAAGEGRDRMAIQTEAGSRAPFRQLWCPDGDQYFPIKVKSLPAACIARIVVPDGNEAQASLPMLLRPGRGGWRPLGAADAGPGVHSLYRRLAVVPRLPDTPAEIRAGSNTYRGAGNLWHRFVPEADGVEPAPSQRSRTPIIDSADHGAATHAPPQPDSAADVLAGVEDAQLLQTADDRFYLPMRDADGRFWLRVEAAGVRAIEVADPREERCHQAVFVQQTMSGKIRWWMQQDASLHKTGTRAAHAIALASSAAPPVSIGPERSRTLAAIDAFLSGEEGRAHLQPAARRAERLLLEAIAQLTAPTSGRMALAPLLDEWPAHLQSDAVVRIATVLSEIALEAHGFNERGGAEMVLVDSLGGDAWHAARDGVIYVTPAVRNQTVERVARMLVGTFIGNMDRGDRIFPSLSDDAAILRRAGRLSTYDPTIMQEAQVWPEREQVASRLAQRYHASAEIDHPMAALATPRSERLDSGDGTDNLSILLRDGETVMALIRALQSAAASDEA